MALEAIKDDLLSKLPEWKAEYEKFGRFIEAAEAMIGITVEASASDVPMPGAPRILSRGASAPATGIVGSDDFVGLSTAEAIKAFLGIMGKGRPQGPRDMARALVTGGRGDADEERAYVNVTSALKRLNKNGEIKQVRRGQWGLSSWYQKNGE